MALTGRCASRCNLIDGAGTSAGRAAVTGEVIEERSVEFPGIEFLDCCHRVSQSAAGDAQEIYHPVQEATVRRPGYVEIGVVGQRSVRSQTGSLVRIMGAVGVPESFAVNSPR
jgi:hypothetical protein